MPSAPMPWAAMSIACGVSLVSMLTPMLLGRMAVEGRILPAQIGQVATVELMALALMTGFASAKLGVDRLRGRIGSAAVVFAVTNLGSAFLDYPWILPLRAVAGLCEGLFVWLLMQSFARSARPSRAQGTYLAMQGVLGFCTISLCSAYILPAFGASGGFIAFGIVSLLFIAASTRLPVALVPLPQRADNARGLIAKEAIGLTAVCFALGGVMALWVYVPAFGAQLHLSEGVIGTAVSIALLFQIAGGVTAATIDTRLSPRRTLLACWLVLVGVGFACSSPPPSWLFVGLPTMVGFLWMFSVPYGTAYIVALDPTRRSLVYLSTVQPVGAAFGPMLASLAVVGADVRGAFLVGGGMIALAAILALGETVHHHSRMRTRSAGD